MGQASMGLQGKNAVVYGAGWGIGRAIALAIAGEGAHVFLAGRARDSLRWVAHEIRRAGGSGEVALVNPLDPDGVEQQVCGIINDRGSLDISFNLTNYETILDPRLTGLTEDAFTSASFTRVRSNFITATTAARKMAYQGNGVILAMVDASPQLANGNFGGFAIGSAALAEMFRQLGQEVGPRGVRVSCLRRTGSPQSPVLEGIFDMLGPVGRGSTGSLRGTELDDAGRRLTTPRGDFTGAVVIQSPDRTSTLPTAVADGASC
jgi:3-oxoacyl-[acyl-carrier protein] reductase